MINKLLSTIKPLLKPLIIVALLLTLVLGDASQALAARTGGRIGGGSFRSPSRTYSAPRGGGYGYPAPVPVPVPNYGYGYGGRIGYPFVMPLPFFWIGGGGLFTIVIFIAIATFLARSVRNAGVGGEEGIYSDNSTISVAKIQVGLLENARYLQKELNDLAHTIDTSSAEGRATLLQESVLSLLRHPEYWTYGISESQKAAIASAEAKFNEWSLAERSKFSAETLSNVNNQLREATPRNTLPSAGGALANPLEDVGEYIIATVLVGVDGRLELPKINDSQDLRQALQQLGSIGSDRLLAVEVLWSPQEEGEALTKDDVLTYYPNLAVV